MRNIIIGDVHGCLFELKALLERCNLRRTDKLFFIGDLIDKGPDSVGVVKFVYKLSISYNVRLILGNHEEKFLRYLRNKKLNPKALKEMIISPDFLTLEENLTTEEINYLHQSYYSFRIPELNVLLVHGGLPGTCKLKFDVDYRYDIHSPKEFKYLDLITKTRYINERGDFISLGMEDEASLFWADVYDGEMGTILFGHQPFFEEKPIFYNNAIGIDLGCVFGGNLLAYIMEIDGVGWEKVKALKNYVII